MTSNDSETLTDREHAELADYVVAEIGQSGIAAFALLFDTAAREGKNVTLKAVLEGEEDPVYSPMAAVTEWHRAVDQPLFSELDKTERSVLINLRRTLISEEYCEVNEELYHMEGPYGSRAKLAAELADLLYVVYGTAQILEIDLPAVFRRIHAKNMEKVDSETGRVNRRADGKILKPIGFQSLTEEEIEAVIN